MGLTRRDFLKNLVVVTALPLVGGVAIGDKLDAKKIEQLVPQSNKIIKWRRYNDLPSFTTPLCEGVLPTRDRFIFEWVEPKGE